MNISEIIRNCVGAGRQTEVDHAEAVVVLLHNVILSPGPLYRIGEWAEPVEPHVLGLTAAQKAAINDDRVGRALEALASERGRNIFFRLALRLIKQFRLDTRRIHSDTTSVSFSGRYEGSQTAPRITFGKSKARRPDLKQLVFGLNVTADGAVPISHQIYSGNRTDDTVHAGNTEELRQILGRDDFIYVADCKLCTFDNLGTIADYGGKFVTVLPRSRKEDSRFRTSLRLRQEPPQWKTILKTPNSRHKSDPPDIYSSCSGPAKTDDGFRLVWIRSSQKAVLDAQARETNLRRAEVELVELGKGLNRRHLKKKREVRQKIGVILKHHRVADWIEATVHQYEEVSTNYANRGRPRANSALREIRTPKLKLQVKRKPDVLRREAHTDGVFPLVTNLTHEPKKGVLQIYKYQAYIEKRFSLLKSELEIAPAYLKKPERVVGLMHAYFIAMALTALIERQVRMGMDRLGIERLPLLPEGRMTSTPTASRILEAFTNVSWFDFARGTDAVAFPIKLSPLQIQLLDLLEVPRTAYT
jgi:transposase